MTDRHTLLSAYKDFYISQGRLPYHVAEFCHASGIEEKDFYGVFSSFQALEQQLFREWAEQTLEACLQDPSYGQYSVRDKLLSVCFTLLETLKPERSMVQAIAKRSRVLASNPAFKGMEPVLGDFFQVLIVEGTGTGEVVARPLVGPRYKDLLWWTVIIVMQYWINDTSEQFEQTDVAVEKNVHLAMDLMAPNALDSAASWTTFYLKSLWSGRAN